MAKGRKQKMTKLTESLEGWKSYLTAAVIIVCGVLDGYGIEVPPYVWAALAAVGLGSLRAAVGKIENGKG